MIKNRDEYKANGIDTLPVNETKSPVCKSWKPGMIKDYEFKGAEGIGIATGSRSGNLEVLDFDNHFGDAKEILSSFVSQCQEIYDKHKFPIVATQGGGYHFFYRCDKIEGNRKLASKPLWDAKNKIFKPDAIIETRGEGGYVVAPPTKGYEVIRNTFENIPHITVQERKFLFELSESFNEWHTIENIPQEEKDRPGDIFNQSKEAGEDSRNALVNGGWRDVGQGKWRRQGKTEGISATFGRVAENIFYCFTSNGYPFEPNKAYTPFQVVCLLKYDGNFKEFAKVLAEKYDLKMPQKKEYGKIVEKEEISKDILEDFFCKAAIDLSVPPLKPPTIMQIKKDTGMRYEYGRLFTLGNFSAITGKSKSKKTYLATMLMAAAAGGGEFQDMFKGSLPEGKDIVAFFDTEQSKYDSYEASKRVWNLLGYEAENFGAFCLREYTPQERCQIIDYGLEKMKGCFSYIVIDGIADLAKSINDEEEAHRVVGLLMKWTTKYNCHITVNIHQNKNDNFATGHLGSAILKKAEAVISVEKDAQDASQSIVRCDVIRGVSDFDEFVFRIDKEGMPAVLENYEGVPQKNYI